MRVFYNGNSSLLLAERVTDEGSAYVCAALSLRFAVRRSMSAGGRIAQVALQEQEGRDQYQHHYAEQTIDVVE